MDRQCSRPACAEPATATLTYHYDRGSVWLDPLAAERDPHGYDLCARHADRMVVPLGWRFEDRRVLAIVGAAPLSASPLPAPYGAPVAAADAPAPPQRLAG